MANISCSELINDPTLPNACVWMETSSKVKSYWYKEINVGGGAYSLCAIHTDQQLLSHLQSLVSID